MLTGGLTARFEVLFADDKLLPRLGGGWFGILVTADTKPMLSCKYIHSYYHISVKCTPFPYPSSTIFVHTEINDSLYEKLNLLYLHLNSCGQLDILLQSIHWSCKIIYMICYKFSISSKYPDYQINQIYRIL